MNHTKQSVVGIDVPLQEFQTGVYTKLLELWGIEIEAYGRVYLNIDDKAKKTIIEAYLKNKDYSGNIITGDKTKFFFFKMGRATEVDLLRSKQELFMIFIVDTNKAKPNIAHYPDEELHKDVRKIIKAYDYLGITVTDFEDNLQSIFKGYEFRYINPVDFDGVDGVKPRHIFKFGLSIIYNNEAEECTI